VAAQSPCVACFIEVRGMLESAHCILITALRSYSRILGRVDDSAEHGALFKTAPLSCMENIPLEYYSSTTTELSDPAYARVRLERAFSDENICSSSPAVPEPTAIHRWYRMIGSPLGPLQQSALISFFATLSLPSGECTDYDSPLARRLSANHVQSWWPFVLDLISDQSQQERGRLAGSDVYWHSSAQRALHSSRDASSALVHTSLSQSSSLSKLYQRSEPDLLRKILSSSNLESPTPIIRSPTKLRKFYFASQKGGRPLREHRRTALISLFGTLSLPQELVNPYPSPLASHMSLRSRRSWWSFVRELVRDQKVAVDTLSDADLFWEAMVHNVRLAHLPLIPTLIKQLRDGSPCSHRLTPQLIHDLYFLSRRSRQSLEGGEHSYLIALFGTLSLPDDVHNQHTESDQALRAIQSPGSSWWGFVLTLIRDKRETKPLSATDAYWLVVARFEELGHSDVIVDLGMLLCDISLGLAKTTL
jgi:hypothetical protein